MIRFAIWGNKRGLKLFYSNVPFDIQSTLEDPTSYVEFYEPKLIFYSLDRKDGYLVYTQCTSIFDSEIRPRSILAISLLIEENKIVDGRHIVSVLNELSSKYIELYLDRFTNSIKDVQEDWSIFEAIVNKYQLCRIAQPKSITLNEHVSNYAVIKYNNETDIKDYLENPYRDQYRDYKEIYFIPAGKKEIVAAPQLTDLTHLVPPKEKSYKVGFILNAPHEGAILPNLDDLEIKFWVNQKLVDKNNAEVYKGDEISIIVDHPNFESEKKTYTIGNINGDKVYLEIPLNYKPKTIKISIVDDRNQPISQDVEVTISDSKGKYEKIKSNYQGLYDVQVSYGDEKFYGVTSSDYDVTNGNGRIDFSKDEITVNLKRKEVPKTLIGPTVNQGGQSDKGKYSPGDQIDLGGGSSSTDPSQTKIGFWENILLSFGIGKKRKENSKIILAIIIGSLAILGLIFALLKKFPKKEIEPNELVLAVTNKEIDSLYSSLKKDSTDFLLLKVPDDSISIYVFDSTYQDKSFKKRLEIDTTNKLLILHQINKDSIKLKKDQLEKFKNESANGSSSDTDTDSGGNQPKIIELTNDEKKKFDFVYALEELTKGKNQNGVNARLKELYKLLNKQNLNKTVKDEYQKRYNALNKFFDKIEECKQKEIQDKEICLKSLKTDSYTNNLSDAQKQYIKDPNKWVDFVKKINN